MIARWRTLYLVKGKMPIKIVGLILGWAALTALVLSVGALPISRAADCVAGPHSGNITADQRWCVQDNPHIVSGDISVNAGVTLTLEAGVQVYFNTGRALSVYGGLMAEGTATQPIIFTAVTPGDTYSRLQFLSGSRVRLDYCDISRSGSGWDAAVQIESSDVVIDHCTIHDNVGNWSALRLTGPNFGAGLSPTIRNTTIANNTGYAIRQDTVDMTPLYQNLTLTGNGTDAVFVSWFGDTINRPVTLDGPQLNGRPFVAENLRIAPSQTLTLTPGTELRFTSGQLLEVQENGTLIAEGTPARPITITAHPPGGTYQRILFYSGSRVRLDYCDISRSGNGRDGAVQIESSDVIIDHCTIHDNVGKWSALLLTDPNWGAGLSPTIRNTTIASNTGYAIYQYTVDMTPLYQNLTLTGNGTDAVFLRYGTINRPVTLDGPQLNGRPFIAENLRIAPSQTLTLTPGTELRFTSGQLLEVQENGTLIAEGTPTRPITITAHPLGGTFYFILFKSGSHVRLDYCDISRTGKDRDTAIHIESSDVVIDHCTIHDNVGKWSALLLTGPNYGAGLSPTIRNTTITSNTGYAIYQYTVDMTPLYQNLTLTGNGTDAVFLRYGTINRPVTLDGPQLNGRPFIAENLRIAPSQTLTLTPGTELRFTSGQLLEVQENGTLIAEGTPARPITFTSSMPSPVPGAWQFIRAQANSRVRLRYCDLAYAGSAGLWTSTSDVLVHGCRIHDATGSAIAVDNNSLPTLTSNRFYNVSKGVNNGTPATWVDARFNWWGHASGPYHPTLNPAGQGVPVSNGVYFQPWLGTFNWLEPTSPLLHGTATLAWAALGMDPTGVTADILAFRSGASYTLGTGRPAEGSLAWNTQDVPDGLYELWAVFDDAEKRTIGTATRIVGINNAANLAWHAGRIRSNETWTADRIHIVEENVTVASGVTLNIEAGAVVKFVRDTSLRVETGAILNAPATGDQPIVLTSLADDTAGGDTNQDGAMTLPLPGDWAGITAQGTGQVNLSPFVDLRYVTVIHTGPLVSNETWMGTFGHNLVGNVTVPSGVTLTIQPGAIVKIDPGGSLIVNAGGTLIAHGTVGQPILFTSSRDDAAGGDTNRDGNATSPQPGDWYRIWINGGTASFDHVEIRYGAGTDSVNGALIRTDGAAALTIANSTLNAGLYTGLLAWGGVATVTNSIVYDTDRGISAHPGSTVYVINSTVDENRIGLLIHGGTLNVANTLVTHNAQYGILRDLAGPDLAIRYSDVWNPTASGGNYGGTADRTGQQGNISADPRYKNRDDRNYRLNYVSPAIDAADGGVAPATDLMGAARYDDPRTANTGIPTSGGAYADMGAYEFVETADSNIDLIVSGVQGPRAVTAGETVSIAWTVVNNGVEWAHGPWHNRVELVPSAELSSTVLVAGEILVGDGVTLGPGQQFHASGQIRVPGGVEGDYFWQVETNSRGDVFEGRNRVNNITRSQSTVALTVPELVLDAAPLERQFTAMGQPHWFKVTQPTDQDVEIFLQSADGGNIVDLYAGQGYIPSWQRHDYRQTQDYTADPRIILPKRPLLPGQQPAIYYLLASPSRLAGDGRYTIGARRLAFELISVRPTRVGNVGEVTLELRGGGLEPNTDFGLIAPDGSVIPDLAVHSLDGTLVEVTFDLTGRPEGWYDVQVTGPAGTTVMLDAVQVVGGVPPRVSVDAFAPNQVRLGDRYSYVVRYRNTGNVDAPITLLQAAASSVHDVLGYEEGFMGSARKGIFPTHALGYNGYQVTWSDARMGQGVWGTLTIHLVCNADCKFRSTATAVPYNRGASSLRDDPSIVATHEILTATPEELDAITHLVGDSGTSDVIYEMRISEATGAITPTLLYTDEVAYETAFLEMAVPSGAMGAAGEAELTPVTAKKVSLKIKVPKGFSPLRWVRKLERAKRVLEIVQQEKPQRDLYLDLNRCLDELGCYKEPGKAEAMARLGRGRFWLWIGTVTAEEVLEELPYPLRAHYQAQLKALAGTAKLDWWLTQAGKYFVDGSGKYRCKRTVLNVDPLLQYPPDANGFLKSVLNNPEVQTCLKRTCKTKGSTSVLGGVEAAAETNETCEFQMSEDMDSTLCVWSMDPNDKIGPQGAGLARFIAPWQDLAYSIGFENVITATAPAQTVVITDQLDSSKLDLSTFQLGPMSFGDTIIAPPEARTEFATLVDLRPAKDLLVQIDAGLNPDTGEVTWRFVSLDSLTQEPPEDPLVGFLPPNAAPPEGQGYVFYTVQPKPDLTTGAEIRNQAVIVFDQNEPILTPEWFNTIDADAPTSSVEPLPDTSPATFPVRWSGSDASGSGIAYYDVYVSVDGGAFTLWQVHTDQTEALYYGAPDHTYSFYSVAIDRVGNRQPTPTALQATTRVTWHVYLPLVLRRY